MAIINQELNFIAKIMSKDEESNNYGITPEVKEELLKLAYKIEEGTLPENELSAKITDDIAKAFLILAKAVEEGTIDDKDLAMYLAMIIRKMSRGKLKSLKKKKKSPKTVMDVILDRIMKNFVQANVNRRNQQNNAEQNLVNNLVRDLEEAINKLRNDPSLDSDVNDIRLMEDVIAVGQKMSALQGRVSIHTKGVGNALTKGMASYASISGNKGIASLSSLKTDLVGESWSEANKIDFEQASRSVGDASVEQHNHQSIKDRLKEMIKDVDIASGPNDVPTTEAAKILKEKKNKEWEISSSAIRRNESL